MLGNETIHFPFSRSGVRQNSGDSFGPTDEIISHESCSTSRMQPPIGSAPLFEKMAESG